MSEFGIWYGWKLGTWNLKLAYLLSNFETMIQRIQTVFLAVGVIAMSLMLFMNLGTLQLGDQSVSLFYASAEGAEASGNMVLLITIPLSILGLILTIVMFRNRKTQLMLSRLVNLLLAGVVVGLYLYITAMAEGFESTPQVGKTVAAFMPLVALLGNFLAYRAIMKDEKLVKSVDRIR